MHCVGTQSPSHHPVHPVPNVLGREPPGLGDPVHSHSHPVTPAQYFRDWVNALGHEVECALHSVTCGLHRTVTCRLHRDDDWVNALPTQYFRDWVGHEVECALHCVLGFTL